MNDNKYFNAGDSHEFFPRVDKAHQAVHALRGYTYQCLAAALAWIDISQEGKLYLEVAEDYAIVAKDALQLTQVKDTKQSGTVTLNSTGIRKAIRAFVKLVEMNPGIDIEFHFMTTSEIGTERNLADRLSGTAGLDYWKEVAKGEGIAPLRTKLQSGKFGESVRNYCVARSDKELRDSLIRKIHWNCGKPNIATLREELQNRLVVIGRDRFKLPSEEARRLVNHLVQKVLETSIIDDSKKRVLTRADFYELVDAKTQVSVPRASLETFLVQLTSNVNNSFGEQASAGEASSVEHAEFFIDGETLPDQWKMIRRLDIEVSAGAILKKTQHLCFGRWKRNREISGGAADRCSKERQIFHCGLP